MRKLLHVLSLALVAMMPPPPALGVDPGLTATMQSSPESSRLDYSYPWGRVQLSAATPETVRKGGQAIHVFQTDVLADLRFADGRRYLLATGRLELDLATGDFTATGWPFLCAMRGSNSLRSEAADESASVHFQGGNLKLTNTPRSYPVGEPAIMQHRRQQISKLEKGL